MTGRCPPNTPSGARPSTRAFGRIDLVDRSAQELLPIAAPADVNVGDLRDEHRLSLGRHNRRRGLLGELARPRARPGAPIASAKTFRPGNEWCAPKSTRERSVYEAAEAGLDPLAAAFRPTTTGRKSRRRVKSRQTTWKGIE